MTTNAPNYTVTTYWMDGSTSTRSNCSRDKAGRHARSMRKVGLVKHVEVTRDGFPVLSL